jgi:hypothetical protein
MNLKIINCVYVIRITMSVLQQVVIVKDTNPFSEHLLKKVATLYFYLKRTTVLPSTLTVQFLVSLSYILVTLLQVYSDIS